VEKITLKRPMRLDSDMVLRGRVVWVGSSSMDIRMEVVDAAGRECLVSHFLFVARNPFTQTSQRVNPLRVESAEDREMFEERGQWAAARKARAQAQRGDASVVGKGEEGAAERRERWIADIMDKSQVAQDMPALVPSVRVP
jgi:acyl-coenzyme A thioesterase 9